MTNQYKTLIHIRVKQHLSPEMRQYLADEARKALAGDGVLVTDMDTDVDIIIHHVPVGDIFIEGGAL